MKYLYALFFLILVACAQPQYAPQPVYQPSQYVAPPQVATAPQVMPQQAEPKVGLGASRFTTHPYLVGNVEAASVRPGTPIVGKLVISKALANNPPITEDVTIFITVIYPTGDHELFGTADVPGIIPSNIIMFDHSPNVQAWTNDKFVANADINTKIKYIVFIKYHDDSRYLLHTINVR